MGILLLSSSLQSLQKQKFGKEITQGKYIFEKKAVNKNYLNQNSAMLISLKLT
jgi:hypothetical protein